MGGVLFTRIILGLLLAGVVRGGVGIPGGEGKEKSAVGKVLGLGVVSGGFVANISFLGVPIILCSGVGCWMGTVGDKVHTFWF